MVVIDFEKVVEAEVDIEVTSDIVAVVDSVEVIV